MAELNELPFQQWKELKARHLKAIALFRLYDVFYTFNTDAKKCHDILKIPTKRKGKAGEQIRVAEFSASMMDSYLPKLVKAGEKVAILEQLEHPATDNKISIKNLMNKIKNN